MKIKTTPKGIDHAPKTYTRIILTEDTVTKLIERASGVTELSIGVGKFSEVTPRTFRILCRTIVRTARTHKLERLAVHMEHSLFPKLDDTRDEAWFVSTMVENYMLASYEYTAYKSKQPTYDLKEILICGPMNAAARRGLSRGNIVGEYANLCRDIANTPGGDMTPLLLAQRAKQAISGTAATVKVLNRQALKKEKMGAILGVAQGSQHEPCFIVIEYWGAGKPTSTGRGRSKAPIIFAGKGITFDTGGLNIKPGDSMLDMHLDMSGGAAVIAAVAAAARLKLKRNIIGLIPAAENAISGESFRPGDVLTTLSGKTVDVLNTDAEGRLVLADALTYAKRYNPKLVIDIATLTGAALVALGEHASALMTKDDTLRERLMELSEQSGDYLWPLPLWNEYKQYTTGRFGDIANIQSSGNPRSGGAINGGMFLSHFAEYGKDCGWAHIDMAPRMISVASDKLAKGSTGEPVRLLVAIAEEYEPTMQ